MNRDSPKSALLIAGPTASGKSALAIIEARKRGGVIINADSMQVYRDLRILSARPSAEEEAQAPHRLYGQVSGGDDYSVARWLADAKVEMLRCWDEGALPIICGGTGLYFRALEMGLAETPLIDAEVREKWRSFAGDLHTELSKRDPEAAKRLNPADRQRIIRALEVVESTGRTLAQWQADAAASNFLNQINVERVYVNVPREALYARAERRFDVMMQQGALDEVKALPAFNAAQPIMKAIGVPELLAHVRGEISIEQAVIDGKTATRQYIKRQLTWWRGQMRHWHDAAT
jgi:tRNA dimethylallyltransferase